MEDESIPIFVPEVGKVFFYPHVSRKNRPKKCEMCGAEADLRHYGKNGAWVCFPCGMKDEITAKNEFSKHWDALNLGRN